MPDLAEGDVLTGGVPLGPTCLLTPEIVLSLSGLAALALLPVAWRSLRRLGAARDKVH